MKLEDLGYHAKMDPFMTACTRAGWEPARVSAEHKERYTILTIKGESEAEITGNLRFSASSREDFPAVGDWVAVATFDPDFAIIHQVMPRYSVLKRQAAGHSGDIQIIAANIDVAFLVQAADRDFNLNRLERYLTICYSAKVSPVVVLTKTDLAGDPVIAGMLSAIQQRTGGIPAVAVSNQTRDGYDTLYKLMEKGRTYCMLGSSGVGKSTLLNNLSGRNIMKTNAISQSTNKGRHVTSHRELVILDNGSILIDNPGMREVGLADEEGGLETAFNKIVSLSHSCRYKDCTHTTEAGCSVIEAVEKGELDAGAWENFLKMEREKAHYESTVAERRRREKIFGKILKDYQKKNPKQGEL